MRKLLRNVLRWLGLGKSEPAPQEVLLDKPLTVKVTIPSASGPKEMTLNENQVRNAELPTAQELPESEKPHDSTDFRARFDLVSSDPDGFVLDLVVEGLAALGKPMTSFQISDMSVPSDVSLVQVAAGDMIGSDAYPFVSNHVIGGEDKGYVFRAGGYCGSESAGLTKDGTLYRFWFKGEYTQGDVVLDGFYFSWWTSHFYPEM